MKIGELQSALTLSDDQVAHINVDPLGVVSTIEFARKDPRFGPPLADYRIRALKRLIDNRLTFASDINVIYDMASQWVHIHCPKCQTDMKNWGGGGNSSAYNVNYECTGCKIKIVLTMPLNGLAVEFGIE